MPLCQAVQAIERNLPEAVFTRGVKSVSKVSKVRVGEEGLDTLLGGLAVLVVSVTCYFNHVLLLN